MNCLRSLRSVSFRRRSRCSALFSIRSALLLLSLSSAAKTFEQDATFKGHDISTEHDDDLENAGGYAHAHGLPSDARDRLDAADLLGILTKTGEQEGLGEERGIGSGEKQRWLNRRPLRVWSQRESGRISSVFREDEGLLDSPDRLPHIASLPPLKKQLNSGRRADNDGSSSTSSNEGKIRYGETVFDDGSFLSGDDGFHSAAAMMMGRLRGLDEKRKWERNSLRVWGKRSDGSDDLKDMPSYPNMRRRKWENLPLRVWGK